jgi:hypothetical protein
MTELPPLPNEPRASYLLRLAAHSIRRQAQAMERAANYAPPRDCGDNCDCPRCAMEALTAPDAFTNVLDDCVTDAGGLAQMLELEAENLRDPHGVAGMI